MSPDYIRNFWTKKEYRETHNSNAFKIVVLKNVLTGPEPCRVLGVGFLLHSLHLLLVLILLLVPLLLAVFKLEMWWSRSAGC